MYTLKNTAIHVFAINNSRILIDLFLFTLHTCIYDKNGNALSLGGKTINENVQVFKYCSVRHLKYLTNRRNYRNGLSVDGNRVGSSNIEYSLFAFYMQ